MGAAAKTLDTEEKEIIPSASDKVNDTGEIRHSIKPGPGV